ncbi:chemotaxis protein CheW [Fredinandcohnia humi]
MEAYSKVITFTLNKQDYAIDINQISSIERLQQITKVPGVSDSIKGMINLRGRITPIIDLKERLSIGNTTDSSESRIVIVENNASQVGLIVDDAKDVLDLDTTAIEPAPESMHAVKDSFIKGVAKLEGKLLLLLDVKQVIREEEKDQCKELHQ